MIEYPPIAPDSTGVEVYFRAADVTTGAPVTVTAATPGISLSYRREGAAPAAISLSDLGALTAAHTDGGLLVVGAGLHRLDVPDAAFAAGSDDVLIFGSATDIVIFGALVPLGIPAGSLDATAFTSNALASIQNEVDIGLTNFGTATPDNVWDELLSEHASAGSAGEALGAAGTAGDPWITQLPGAYAPGTAGFIVGSGGDSAAIADRILGRNIAGGSDGGRTVRSALRRLRNKVEIAAGVMIVYQEDDETPDYSAIVITAPSDPISSVDPS